MKTHALVLFAIATLLLPYTASAQLFGAPIDERAPWAFEASAFGNFTAVDFGQMNDHLKGAPEAFSQQAVYSGYKDVNTFDNITAFDFRIGFRIDNFHFGGGYQTLTRAKGGYVLEHVTFGDLNYDIDLSSREFYAYAGYLYPINDWLSVGPMLSYGYGTIEGHLTDDVQTVDGRNVDNVSLAGAYQPFRAELRARAHLTQFVTLDIGGGMRTGTSSDLEADYGLDGVYGLPDSKGPVQDYQDMPIDLDYSGWYFSAGITLVNPMGMN